MLGSLVMVNFTTQLITDAISIKYIDRIGQRRAAIIAQGLAAIGMLMMAILPRVMSQPFVGLVISSIVFAIGGGLIEVLVSPIVESLPGEAKASTMSLLHSFYSWGQVLVIVLSTLALLLIGHDLWFVIPLGWSLLPIVTLIKFVKVPLVPLVEESERISLKKLITSKAFLLALLLMVCSGATEQAMGQWASLFAEEGLGLSKVMGDLLGPCLFAVMMGIARTLYGVKGTKINIHKTLPICSLLCILSFVITAIVPIPAVALLGCALCGLGVGLMWPGTLSITAASHPAGGTAMFAIMALSGDMGCSIGPWLTGLVAERSTLNIGLLVAIIFPSVMFVGLVVMNKSSKSEKKSGFLERNV